VADHVYRRFTRENLFTTTILAQNRVIVSSGTAGWTGNTNLNNNTLSLYGGVRSRSDVGSGSTSGLELYPLDQVDTKSIDGVIQIPGQYPQTGSITLVYCRNYEQPQALATTGVFWYEEHHSVIRRLSDWYSSHYKRTYPTNAQFTGSIGVGPFTPSGSFTAFHVPEMFYGRQIASGSVLCTVNAFNTGSAISNSLGTVYWKDYGYGRLWEVRTSSSAWNVSNLNVGNVFYNEGLIVFTATSSLWHQQLISGEGIEPHITLQFDGSYPIKSMVALCRMNPAEVNASNNPSYYYTDETGKRWAHTPQGNTEVITYTTAIGIYNEERQLVAVAKMAQPIRKREHDDLDFKLRLDL